jgi:hypothetical protein
MKFSFRLSQLNQPQLKWLAKLFTDLGKAFFIIGVVGFIIPSIDIPVTPIKFGLAFLLSLTMFFFAGRILKLVKP